MEVRSFAQGLGAVPSVSDLDMTTYPAGLAEMYERIGLTTSVEDATALHSIGVARENYPMLDDAEYNTWRELLTEIYTMPQYKYFVPQDALSVLVTATESNIFGGFQVLMNPTTHESLVIGTIRARDVIYRFKITQWSEHGLTDPSKVRKPRRHLLRDLVLQGKRWFSSTLRRQEQGVVYFGLLCLLSVMVATTVFLLLGWWLAFGALIALTVSCGIHVSAKGQEAAKVTVTVVFVVAFIGAFIVGGFRLYYLNTTPHELQVLVCSQASTTDPNNEDASAPPTWHLNTNEGQLFLDPGFYNGIYYDSPNKSLAESLVGKWVKVISHGGIGPSNSYVTQVTTVKPGSCGNN